MILSLMEELSIFLDSIYLLEANSSQNKYFYMAVKNVERLLNEILGKWTHIAVTVGYENIIVYINGNKTAQYTKIILDYSQCYNAIAVGKICIYIIQVMHSLFFLYTEKYGNIYYDNFISATEVKENQ